METMLKKVLYTGVGVVATTTERVQKALDELIEKGKSAQEEGKEVVEDVSEHTEEKKESYEERLRRVVDNALAKFNLPAGKDYKKMEKRVKSLEVKLGLLIKELEEKYGEKMHVNPEPIVTETKTEVVQEQEAPAEAAKEETAE